MEINWDKAKVAVPVSLILTLGPTILYANGMSDDAKAIHDFGEGTAIAVVAPSSGTNTSMAVTIVKNTIAGEDYEVLPPKTGPDIWWLTNPNRDAI